MLKVGVFWQIFESENLKASKLIGLELVRRVLENLADPLNRQIFVWKVNWFAKKIKISKYQDYNAKMWNLYVQNIIDWTRFAGDVERETGLNTGLEMAEFYNCMRE